MTAKDVAQVSEAAAEAVSDAADAAVPVNGNRVRLLSMSASRSTSNT
ncbi:hypothetical protein [Lentzea guizhouensis]|nr:hypothetical protein [Lentzea guizhouensis]